MWFEFWFSGLASGGCILRAVWLWSHATLSKVSMTSLFHESEVFSEHLRVIVTEDNEEAEVEVEDEVEAEAEIDAVVMVVSVVKVEVFHDGIVGIDQGEKGQIERKEVISSCMVFKHSQIISNVVTQRVRHRESQD